MLGFFYGDIMGLEGASGLCFDQPCRRRVGKGDEFNKAVQAPPVPPRAPAAPAPAAGENGASPSDEPPTLPGGEGAEAGAGNPAPGKGAVTVLPPAASKPGCRLRMKNKASMSFSKSLCARYEHSRTRNKQFSASIREDYLGQHSRKTLKLEYPWSSLRSAQRYPYLSLLIPSYTKLYH